MEKGDAQVLIRLRVGDAAAFTTVLDRFEQKVKGYCEAKAPPDGRAEDLSQQTFVQFFAIVQECRDGTWATFDDIEHLLIIIATRALIDDARKEAAELKKRERYGAYRIFREQRLPDEILLSKEAEDLVQREIVRLDPRQREIALLAIFEEMTTQQMSAVLELPDWNVRRLFRSGQETLVERLEFYFKGVKK